MGNLTRKQVTMVVVFAMILLLSIGALTYAFFTAGITLNNSNTVDVTTIGLPNLEINVLAKQGDSTNVYPGWIGYQVVTVEGQGGNGSNKYNLTMSSPIIQVP